MGSNLKNLSDTIKASVLFRFSHFLPHTRNQSSARLVHDSLNGSQQFEIVHKASRLLIKDLENHVALSFGDIDSLITDDLFELLN
jgi:serine acetyltransferase